MTHDIKAVLFDLDGTLIDSAPDLHNCINKVLIDHSKPKVEFSKFRRLVSQGTQTIIKECFHGQLEDGMMEHLRNQFWKYYSNSLTDKTELFPDIDIVLNYLIEGNIPWGIVTNKIEKFAKPIIKHFGWNMHAATVIYGDTLAVSKPNPEPLLMAAEQLKTQPENCVYIGDTSTDVVAAKAAKMTNIIVGYGYSDLNLRELQQIADHFITKAIFLKVILPQKN
ncbi:MAG: HAD-IA family hydrolase [Pseudomonadota bacterium]|jgi:phosphoglycolate phosphatase|nr:HAD-IA family hydrolase [Pseudomonadota bacterium]